MCYNKKATFLNANTERDNSHFKKAGGLKTRIQRTAKFSTTELSHRTSD